MQHFLRLAHGLDILPLLYALYRQPHLWDAHPVRTTFPGSPHAQVSDILLRFNTGAEYEAHETAPTADDGQECIPYPAWWALPEVHPLVFTLFGVVRGTRLGRVMITRLAPGCAIPPHIDSKSQTDYFARHHITLAAPQWGCVFQIEEEQVEMQPGEAWLIDNSKTHGVTNDGDSDRISLIVDVHSDRAP